MSDRTPVIVGIGLSDYPVAPHLSEREHHAQALQRALSDCGIPKRDIDGFMTFKMQEESENSVAEYLGINFKVFGGLGVGGAGKAGRCRAGLASDVLLALALDLGCGVIARVRRIRLGN